MPKRTNPDIEQLFDQQASILRTHLNYDIRYDMIVLPRPFIIEITGSQEAGKSVMITELYNTLRKLGLVRIFKPQEGAEQIFHVPRSTPLYNIRTGLYAASLLIDQSHQHSADIVIFDRCLFDAYAWMTYWVQKGLLSSEQAQQNQLFFLQPHLTKLIDITYVVVCDPKVAIQRSLRNASSQRFAESTNPESVARMYNIFRQEHADLAPTYPQLQLVDTTHMSLKNMNRFITARTLELLVQKCKTAPK